MPKKLKPSIKERTRKSNAEWEKIRETFTKDKIDFYNNLSKLTEQLSKIKQLKKTYKTGGKKKRKTQKRRK